MPNKSKKMEYISPEERRFNRLKREALTLEQLKKLSPAERKKYIDERRGVKNPSNPKKSKKRPKHRDPGQVERMMEFEKSLRGAGLAKGGYVNCGASMKPTQKMSKGGYARKK